MSKFLNNILGEAGFKSTSNAIEKYPLLKSVILPRAILSWVSVMGDIGFEGEVPGVDGVYLSLNKSENDLYEGALVINNELYAFEDADALHVAASLGVAIGVPPEPLNDQLRSRDLTKLGKSVDLIVKSEALRKIKKGELDSKVQAVKPTEPVEHAEPIKPMGKQPNIKIPRKPKQNLAIGQGQAKFLIKKSEADRRCTDCDSALFVDDKFKACICLGDFSRYIKSEVEDDKIVLTCDKGLDSDSISLLMSVLMD